MSSPSVQTMRASAMGDVVQAQSKQNMKDIVEKASDNIELQAILLSTIAGYEVSKAAGTLSRKKRRPSVADPSSGVAGSDAASPGVAEQLVPVIPPDEVLDRNKTVWIKWSVKTLKELLYYVDPVTLNMEQLKDFIDKKRILEM
eukprot:5587837-Heterocapsa_arctica.AAC.1